MVEEARANQLAADAVATHNAGPADPLRVLLLPFDACRKDGVDATTTLLLSDAKEVVVANREWYVEQMGKRPIVGGKALRGADLERWWAGNGAPAVIETLKVRGFIRFLED